MLDSLRKEREERRAAAGSGADIDTVVAAHEPGTAAWEKRKAERNALVQQLLSERQANPSEFPVRSAWEERLERHTNRIEAQLGLAGTLPRSPHRSQPSSPSRPAPSGGSMHATSAGIRGGIDEALNRAARERAELEANAIDLGALGSAELEAIGSQAAEELARLGAAVVPGASNKAPTVPQGAASGDTARPSAIPRASPSQRATESRFADVWAGSTSGGSAGSAGTAAKPRAASVNRPARQSIGGGDATAARASRAPGRSSGATTGKPAGKAAAGGAAGASGAVPAAAGPTFQPMINENSAKMAEKRGPNCYARLATQRVEAYAKREMQRMEVSAPPGIRARARTDEHSHSTHAKHASHARA